MFVLSSPSPSLYIGTPSWALMRALPTLRMRVVICIHVHSHGWTAFLADLVSRDFKPSLTSLLFAFVCRFLLELMTNHQFCQTGWIWNQAIMNEVHFHSSTHLASRRPWDDVSTRTAHYRGDDPLGLYILLCTYSKWITRILRTAFHGRGSQIFTHSYHVFHLQHNIQSLLRRIWRLWSKCKDLHFSCTEALPWLTNIE